MGALEEGQTPKGASIRSSVLALSNFCSTKNTVTIGRLAILDYHKIQISLGHVPNCILITAGITVSNFLTEEYFCTFCCRVKKCTETLAHVRARM